MKKSYLTPILALAKLQKYCAYRDRSISEAQRRLRELDFKGKEADAIIAELLKDNFLNEERFACSFCRGKFYIKGWGKRKIRNELFKKQVSNRLIDIGMQEIDLSDYRNKLVKILRKKRQTIGTDDWNTIKIKLARHALTKGYEIDLIYHLMNELHKKNKL